MEPIADLSIPLEEAFARIKYQHAFQRCDQEMRAALYDGLLRLNLGAMLLLKSLEHRTHSEAPTAEVSLNLQLKIIAFGEANDERQMELFADALDMQSEIRRLARAAALGLD